MPAKPASAQCHSQGFTLIELLIVVAIIILLAAIAVPNFFNAKRAANESSAVASMRAISSGELAYRGTHGVYTDMDSLRLLEIIDSALGSGTKSGYAFTAVAGSDPAIEYTATASPTAATGFAATGRRFYYVCQDQIIRFKAGSAADASSTPIN